MGPLSRGVTGESITKDEELMLFETEHDIKMLLEQLEQKDESKT